LLSRDCLTIAAIRDAPATWELDGPLITGPITSLNMLDGSFSIITSLSASL